MKKALLLFVLMSLTLFTHAQENNYEELKFFKVIQSENNADKNSLYAALRSFMAIYYANSQNVIQMDDKDAGILIGKATSVFDLNPAKRKAMAVKNEKRFLKQKRNALKNPGYSHHPVKTQASFKRLLKAV